MADAARFLTILIETDADAEMVADAMSRSSADAVTVAATDTRALTFWMRTTEADTDAAAETVALASIYLAPPSSANVAEASGENANIYVSDYAVGTASQVWVSSFQS